MVKIFLYVKQEELQIAQNIKLINNYVWNVMNKHI